MPYLQPEEIAGKKRKRTQQDPNTRNDPSFKKSSRAIADAPTSRETEILELERQIHESRKYYNNIVTLISIAREDEERRQYKILAAVALCRVFSRLLNSGNFETSKETTEAERVIIEWLRERKHEYVSILVDMFALEDEEIQNTAMTLTMRVVEEEVKRRESAWSTGVWPTLFAALLLSEAAVDSFADTFFVKYDDVRYHSLQRIPSTITGESIEDAEHEQLVSNIMTMLFKLETPPKNDADIQAFLGLKPANTKHSIFTANAHRKAVQDAWLSVLRLPLTQEQRKGILTNLVDEIVPWFSKVERLADFLTDSYGIGGSTTLLALAGVFHLMTERNLDYPAFYQKLYSLLDDGLLHSKNRSRFLRLLDTFMSSTHLPAALVASFVKRLARLALSAPPSGIVVVIPWVYNMIKRHPQCSFMIQRVPADEQERLDWQEHGHDDPFNMEEPDPMVTGAIDSSLWEIETLQSHYHPNVAMLAKIISEQFTKQSYNLEDFLDHSYNSLIEAELGKAMKKAPVVEYQIPKTIFTTDNGELNQFGALMLQVIQ